MAKWNHEVNPFDFTVVIRATTESIETMRIAMRNLVETLEKNGVMNGIYDINSSWVKRKDFQFTLEDWHVPERWAEWIAFHLPGWLFPV